MDIRQHKRLKRIIYSLIMNERECRPRFYIRILAPFYQKRALSSKIYSSVRMDTPPFHSFNIGRRSVVESFSCINNACGSVKIGNDTRVGMHNTIIGPVTLGNKVILAQGVVMTALNHSYLEPCMPIADQKVTLKEVVVEDDVWIGANATILQGVRVGSHSIIAAGAVVTKDVPPHTIVGGVPARVLKHI